MQIDTENKIAYVLFDTVKNTVDLATLKNTLKKMGYMVAVTYGGHQDLQSSISSIIVSHA